MIKIVNYGGIKTIVREVWYVGFDQDRGDRWYYLTYFSMEGVEDGFTDS